MAETTKRRPAGAGPGTKRRTMPARRPPAPRYGRYRWTPWAVGLAALVVVVVALRAGGEDRETRDAGANPVVGADLHSLVVDPTDPDRIYIGSHDGVSVSRDAGKTWESIESLDGADAMGWAFTPDAIFVGGHPGLYVSTDGGEDFEQRNEGLPSSDVHALGAGGDVIYAASPAAGVFASTDGGASWEVRTQEAGQAFMGRILVDPQDDEHLVAPDMEAGPVESRDGGRTWRSLGGAQGATWVSWDDDAPRHVVVTGQGGAVRTMDGGNTWDALEVPQGALIVEVSPHDADVLYAAALDVPEAVVYVSRDGGATWARP